MITYFRIKTNLVVAFLLCSVIPLALLTHYSASITEQSVQAAVSSKFAESASYAMKSIDELLYARKTDLESWVKDPIFQEAAQNDPKGALSEKLKKFKRDYGMYSALYVISNNGKIIASSEPTAIGRSVTNEVWYKAASRPFQSSQTIIGKDYNQVTASIGDLEYDSLSASYGVNLSVPILSSSSTEIEQYGLLVSRLNWTELFKITNLIRVSPQGQDEHSYAVLINRHGQVITGPGILLEGTDGQNKQKAENVLYSKNFSDLKLSAIAQALGGEKGSVREIAADNIDYIIGYSGSAGYLDFKGLGWAVIVMQQTEDAFASIRKLEHLAYSLLGLAAVVAILFAFGMGDSVKRRLAELETFSLSLKKGYLKERVAVTGADEIANLGTSLNDMADAIHRLVDKEREAREKAENINLEKGQFLEDLATEIKTPIANIIEMNDSLLKTPLSDDQRSLMTSMRKLASALLICSNNMRDISRIETGQTTLNEIDFDLKSILEEVVDLVSISATQAGVSISLKYGEDVGNAFTGDAVRIHQVTTTALSYVLKLTNSQRLYVAVTPDDGMAANTGAIRIVIADSSLAENRDKLRHLYESGGGDKAVSESETSTELTTSKRILRFLGGTLGAVATQDGGIVLWLTLKLQPRA